MNPYDDASIASARAKQRIQNIVDNCRALLKNMSLEAVLKEVKATHGIEMSEEVESILREELGCVKLTLEQEIEELKKRVTELENK